MFKMVAIAFSTTNSTSGQRILTKGRIARRAVIEHRIISFTAYTAAETPNVFQCAEQLPRINSYCGKMASPWFLGPT